jgi:small subunit ribosomal protein SAe
MERYLSHRTETGANIINVLETYNKIRLAARVIAGISHPSQVLVCSSKETGQRAAIKFSHYTKTNCTSNSRWVPGALTNQKTGHFKEPRLVIVVDPYSDRKAIVEASYANIPVIALASLDSDLQFVDICIPCNNKATEPISMVFWLLAREVLILRGEHDKSKPWEVFVDLFYHKQIDLAVAAEEKAADATVEAKGDAAEGEDVEGGDDWGQEAN